MSIKRIKLGAGVLLVACLALPQYTCSKYVGPDGKTVISVPTGAAQGAYREVLERHYPLESFEVLDIFSWLILLTFVWPLPVLAYHWRGKPAVLKRAVWLAEPILAIGSAYGVWELSSVGTRAIGTYLALAANSVYLCAWVVDLGHKPRQRG
ncbi:MAG: hypothetical protein LAO55_24475 [Acidobacteriia bacterium]|nr:hypothetical protein [Terriglobia bacterium]